MKIRYWLVLAMALCSPSSNGQVALPTATSGPAVVESGPHHRVWQTVQVDELGQTNISTYTELATGLNYWNSATGLWEESQEQFVIAPQGYALAAKTQSKLAVAANLNSQAAIDLLSTDNRRFRCHVLRLSYLEVASGKSVMIAEVKDSIG